MSRPVDERQRLGQGSIDVQEYHLSPGHHYLLADGVIKLENGLDEFVFQRGELTVAAGMTEQNPDFLFRVGDVVLTDSLDADHGQQCARRGVQASH